MSPTVLLISSSNKAIKTTRSSSGSQTINPSLAIITLHHHPATIRSSLKTIFHPQYYETTSRSMISIYSKYSIYQSTNSVTTALASLLLKTIS